MEQQEKKLGTKLEQQKDAYMGVMQQQTKTMLVMLEQTETRINIRIENDVEKRMDSVFDGYKLALRITVRISSRIRLISL